MKKELITFYERSRFHFISSFQGLHRILIGFKDANRVWLSRSLFL